MKNGLIFFYCLFFFTGQLHAQSLGPEKIHGKNKVLKPNDYYLQQLSLWKIELDKNPKNAYAWLNYYRASRNAYIQGEEDNSQKAKGLTRFNRLKSIVDAMEQQVPDTYEYNFVKWLNGNNDLLLFPYLEKARLLSPQNPEPLMSLIFYYEIKGDTKKRNESIEAYYKLGDYSPGLLNYSYNLLSALDKNAIVLTEGDKDTEGILILSQGKKLRTDVTLLNLNLLLIKEYRDHLFKELEIAPLGTEPLLNEETYKKFKESIVKHLAGNKKNKPVYLAVTVSDDYTKGIRHQLYLTGLAYLYSEKKMNPLPILLKNIEENFLLDYIKEYFVVNDISAGNVQSMNGNYVHAFASLSEYFQSLGNTSKADYYKNLAYKVAKEGQVLDKYHVYFKDH